MRVFDIVIMIDTILIVGLVYMISELLNIVRDLLNYELERRKRGA